MCTQAAGQTTQAATEREVMSEKRQIERVSKLFKFKHVHFLVQQRYTFILTFATISFSPSTIYEERYRSQRGYRKRKI
jgi:hypothetical protein